jgi:hypothetical protein
MCGAPVYRIKAAFVERWRFAAVGTFIEMSFASLSDIDLTTDELLVELTQNETPAAVKG